MADSRPSILWQLVSIATVTNSRQVAPVIVTDSDPAAKPDQRTASCYTLQPQTHRTPSVNQPVPLQSVSGCGAQGLTVFRRCARCRARWSRRAGRVGRAGRPPRPHRAGRCNSTTLVVAQREQLPTHTERHSRLSVVGRWEQNGHTTKVRLDNLFFFDEEWCKKIKY